MKVYITVYALTQGVIEFDTDKGHEIEVCHDIDPSGNMLMVRQRPEMYPAFFHGKGRQWHETMESAVRNAEDRRQKKIESLKKQIVKLVNLKFT